MSFERQTAEIEIARPWGRRRRRAKRPRCRRHIWRRPGPELSL